MKYIKKVNRDQLSYYCDLIYELVVRDMKIRYQNSVLGFTWTLLTPLFQLVVYFFTFQLVQVGQKMSILEVEDIIWQKLDIIEQKKQTPEYDLFFEH